MTVADHGRLVATEAVPRELAGRQRLDVETLCLGDLVQLVEGLELPALVDWLVTSQV